MPIHDWYCRICDRKVEDVLSRGEDTLCPYCGTKMVKMPAAPALVFKGSGWDTNSYRSGKKVTKKGLEDMNKRWDKIQNKYTGDEK